MSLINLDSEEITSSEIARIFVGDFYENLFLNMFGGKKLEETNEQGCFLPDFIMEEEKKIYEVKGGSKYNYYHLRDCQINGFKELLNHDFRDFKLFFAFFTHGLKNISTNHKNKEELFKNLAEKTESLIILPFSKVKRIHARRKSRYDGFCYDTLTRLYRNGLEEILKKELNHKTYLSKPIFLDEYKIKPFEIVEVN